MKLGWWVFVGLIVVGVGSGWIFHSYYQPSLRSRALDHSENYSKKDSKPVVRPILRKKRVGGLDVTFLVASDTHIGFNTPEDPSRDPLIEPVGIERTNLAMIETMNTIAGKSYPTALGGQVRNPKAVLISGDLTEEGGREQWRLWTRIFGLTGTEGALKFPVFEGAGNHDRNKNWYVREQVAKRHGGRFYYFDWGDLRLVCLDEGPDEAGLKLLAEALAGVEPDVPLILYFHYPLLGPYSDDQWFGRGDFRQRLARAIRGRRVLGLFHGHYHATGAYRWEGFDVYNVGSPKHRHTSFAVVEVKDDYMQVAAYDYLHHKWIWWHRKPLDPTGPDERIGVAPDLESELVPDFTLNLEPGDR